MTLKGIKFSELNQLTNISDSDDLLINDTSLGTSQKVTVGLLSNYVKSTIPTTGVTQIVAGTNVNVNPNNGTGVVEISAAGSGKIIAGDNITISPVSGIGDVTINANVDLNPTLDEVLSEGSIGINKSISLTNTSNSYKLVLDSNNIRLEGGRLDIQQQGQPFLIVANRKLTITSGTGSDIELSSTGVTSLGGFYAGSALTKSVLEGSGLKIGPHINIVQQGDDLLINNPLVGGEVIINEPQLNNPKVTDVLNLNSLTELPTGELGDICQFNNEPYFHDGTDWRRFYLYDRPDAPDAPDPDFADVLSRITFNTDFTDSSASPKTISDNNVFIDVSNTKFGGSSLKVPSTALLPNLSYDFSNDDLIIGDFSFEMWVYPSVYTLQEIYKHEYRQSPGGVINNLTLSMLSNSTPRVSNNGVVILNSSFGMSQNAWNHILLQRDQAFLTMYLNGRAVDSTTFNSIMYMEDIVFLGDNIWIDDFRLTKDVRYTQSSGFISVPTSQLPTTA